MNTLEPWTCWLPFPPVAVERLREVLDYDPETGVFRWKNAGHSKKARALDGKVAGCLHPKWGYRLIRIDYRLYRAARLAWLWTHGRWPSDEIDHINGIRDDDRLINLREATRAQNTANTRAPQGRGIGLKGVSWHAGDRKWRARFDGKFLGNFDTKEAARAAYLRAATERHGEFVRA